MVRNVTLSGALLLCLSAWAGQALACEGQEVIFEDNFADDTGGWAMHQAVEVKDGTFVFKLAPDDMQTDLNVTFTVQGRRYLLRGRLARRRPSDPWRRAPVLGRGQQGLFPVRHPQQRQVLDRAQAGRQVAHHRGERRVERHQQWVRGCQHAPGEGHRQHRVLLHQRHQGARPARPAAQGGGASASPATISTRTRRRASSSGR